MSKKVGDRLPCKVCGADRAGEPMNAMTVRVCQKCYPGYVAEHSRSTGLRVWLGRELKAELERQAALRGVTQAECVRVFLRSALERTER